MAFFVTNTERAAAAQVSVQQMLGRGAINEREAVVDVLTNLMHYARQRGLPFVELVTQAGLQHDIERAEDPEGPGIGQRPGVSHGSR